MNLPLPSPGTVDPWPEIIALVPQKITYKGSPAVGDPERVKGFAKWLFSMLPAVVSDGDEEHKANCFLQWLRSEQTYEADEGTRIARAAAAAAQAPPNPISDRTAPQVAQPPPAPVPAPVAPAAAGTPAPAAEGEMKCLECSQGLKNVTGLKRHCTMTHKLDWSAYCQKHGLDVTSGLRLGTAPAAAPAPTTAPPPPPTAAAVPPMFGAPGQASQPPSFVAPAPPLPGQTSIPFTQPAQVAPQQPTGPLFAQPSMQQPLQQPAQQPFGIPFQQPQMPQQPFQQPQMPQQQFQPPGPFVGGPVPQQPQQMPQPPAQVAMPMPAPLTGAAPPPFVPPTAAPPAAPPMVAYNPNQPPAAQAPAPAPINTGAPTREVLAQMLGGPVDLIIVRLLDAAVVKLDGRTDVNQLAGLAEARAKAELRIADLAQAQYAAGKQAAQRHFADLLTQHPNCYMLQNGYDPIIPDGYLAILIARVTKCHIVTDSGRQTTTIFA